MPHPAPEPLEVLLPRAGAAVMRHRRRLAARHGLTPTAIAILAALDCGADAVPTVRPASAAMTSADGATGAAGVTSAADAPSHRELAGRLGLSPATLTPVLDALEAAGEIRRERDRADRRIVRVRGTAAGRAHLAAARSPSFLPRPAPEAEPAVRAYLLAVLAAVEAED